MPRSRIVAAGAALTTTLAVLAAPALSSALDSGPAATAAMPASWELERALAGRTAAESHATAVAVKKQRRTLPGSQASLRYWPNRRMV